jgi:hypothetical protein
MDDIRWTCEVKDYFQTTEEEITEKWQVVEDDPEWEVISKEEPVANHHEMTKMKLLTELNNLHGLVSVFHIWSPLPHARGRDGTVAGGAGRGDRGVEG